MTKFYFNVRDGDNIATDEEGSEMPDIYYAENEAIQAAREIMAEKVLNGEFINGQSFEISDENGTVVATVPFRAALRLK